ncbi:hypothetical protein VNO77_00967 [Canavalia gladiata]|uniref:Uncharacterized protein n=1 Tax=Canavalia gladiata TaxID=3824 RepID=A0AAN9MV82_CANGL
MAYQNYNGNYYGWRCPSEEYQVYEQPPIEVPHHRHHKGRVAFRTIYEDPRAEVETNVEEGRDQFLQSTRFDNHKAFKSVDQEAEAFIQHEHRRMELARLMSTRAEWE